MFGTHERGRVTIGRFAAIESWLGLALAILCAVTPAAQAAPNGTRAARPSTVRFAVVGDAGVWNAHTLSVRESVRAAGIHHLILPGDNLYDLNQSYHDVWSPWWRKGFIPEVPALGNHTAGYLEEIKYFRMPGEYYTRVYGKFLRMLVLNSDNTDRAREQARWLDRELEGATEPFVLVIYHHPSLTLTERHPWTERAEFHTAIRPLLFKHRKKITAVINGHDHVAAAYQMNDLPVIVSGATHETFNATRQAGIQEKIYLSTPWAYDGTPHWVALEGNAVDKSLHFHFIRAKDSAVTCSLDITTGQSARLHRNCR